MEINKAVLDQRSESCMYIRLNGWVYYIEKSPAADLVSRWRECGCVNKLLCSCSDEELQGETHRFGSFNCESELYWTTDGEGEVTSGD